MNNESGRKDIVTTSNDDDLHTVTKEFWDTTLSPNKLLKKTTTVSKDFPWGTEVITEIEDPDGEARTTSYTYQEDEEVYGYGKVETITNPDGSWVAYGYDHAGRVVNENRPLENSPGAATLWGDITSGKFMERSYGGDDRLEYEYTAVQNVQTNFEGWSYSTEIDAVTSGTLNVTTQNSYPQGGPQTTLVTRKYASNGRLHSIDREDGTRDGYVYDKGLYVSGTFTPDSEGEFERTIVTHGTTEDPEGLANRTTREISIEDADGRTVSEETQVYTDEEEYERITLVLHMYDGDGNLEQTTKNGRITYSATYFDDGRVDTEMDEQGIQTAYTYSGDNVATVTKNGVAAATIEGVSYAAQPDVVTTYEYDMLGRQVSEVVTSGTVSLPERTTTYTVAGDIATQTEGGLTTSYSYASGGRITTVTQPNGATEITENYLDGQTKSITGTGVVHQFFDYGVHFDQEGDGYEDGTLWTQIRLADDESPRWEKTTTDGSGGRTLKVEKPTFDGTGLTTTEFAYNTKGQLIKEKRTGYADRLYIYDDLGRQFRSGFDLNANGTLDLASTDRIDETDEFFSKDEDDGSWGTVNRIIGYLTDLDGTPTIRKSQWRMLTVMVPEIISLQYSTEASGRWSQERARVYRSDKLLEVSSAVSTSSSLWGSPSPAMACGKARARRGLRSR